MPDPQSLSLSLSLADVRSHAGKALSTTADDAEAAAWAGRLVSRLGGDARPYIDDGRVVVDWTPDARRRSGPDEVVEWLKAGQHHEAVVVLELLLSAMPKNEVVLYNLGMAHSDLGELVRAEELLRRCIQINPDNINARVALGVALLRQDRTVEAAPMLEQALVDDPDNPCIARMEVRHLTDYLW